MDNKTFLVNKAREDALKQLDGLEALFVRMGKRVMVLRRHVIRQRHDYDGKRKLEKKVLALQAMGRKIEVLKKTTIIGSAMSCKADDKDFELLDMI